MAEAETTIRKALDKTWSDELIEVYAELSFDHALQLKRAEKWLKARPEDAIEIAKCAYDAYGYSYKEYTYYPERLNAMAQTYLRFAVDRTLEWRAIFEHRFATKTTVPDWYRENQSEVFTLVEEALASDVDVEDQRQEAARALFSAVHGVVALALDEKLGDFDQPRTERQVSFIVSAVARGLTNPS